MVCLPDGDTNFFDMIIGILQGNTLALYVFKICLDYVLQTTIEQMKDSFTLKIATKTGMDADYADNQALLANTSAQDESLQHSLEQKKTLNFT